MPIGSELLYYGGIAAMVISALVAAATLVIFIISGKCLRRRLDDEYGRKRH